MPTAYANALRQELLVDAPTLATLIDQLQLMPAARWIEAVHLMAATEPAAWCEAKRRCLEAHLVRHPYRTRRAATELADRAADHVYWLLEHQNDRPDQPRYGPEWKARLRTVANAAVYAVGAYQLVPFEYFDTCYAPFAGVIPFELVT